MSQGALVELIEIAGQVLIGGLAGFALGASVTLRGRVERVERAQRQIATVLMYRVAAGAGIDLEPPEEAP